MSNIKKIIAATMAVIILSGIIPLGAFATNITEISAENRYAVHQNGYRDKYDLQEGIFTYSSTLGTDRDAVYYYSDGYFADVPEIYNEHLSTMSLALSMSAFNASATSFDDSLHNKYANSFRNVKQLLADMGFEDNNIRISDLYTQKPTDESIGVIMGAKDLSLDGEQILLPVIIRGGGYESEWASNVTLGESGEAKGFSDSASKVLSELEKFISSDISSDVQKALDEGRVKFLVCGYSRAAAVANITAKRLTDKYGMKNGVYAYCFETPKCGVDSAALNEVHTYNGKYLNIHNIINSGDIVTYVAPEEMGFKRYGVDRFIPGTTPGEVIENVYITGNEIKVTSYSDNSTYSINDDAYGIRCDKMISQLALINDGIVFDDSFCLATLNYLGFALGSSGIFLPIKNTEIGVYQWLPVFMNDLTKWTTGGEGTDYRKFYSSDKMFCGEKYVSVEEALQTFAKLMFGLEKAGVFQDAMMYRLKSLTSDKMMIADFYTSVFGSWEKLDNEKQKGYIDKIWKILTDEQQYSDGTSVPKLTDFVADGEKEKLQSSTYSLFSFMFSFINKDSNIPAFENFNAKQVHLATFLYNVSSILQCHYPEICMAWLRTYDSHYEENDKFNYENVSVLLDADASMLPTKFEAKGEKKDGSIHLTLTALMNDTNSSSGGSAIYYRILKNGECITDWSLYQDYIVINDKDISEYSINTFAARFGMKTDIHEIAQDQIVIENSTGKITAVIIFAVFAAVALGTGIFLYFKKKEKNNA